VNYYFADVNVNYYFADVNVNYYFTDVNVNYHFADLSVNYYFADVNVEHMQVLLFLFHSLHLMQKKQLLLQMAQNIVKIGTLDPQ